MPLDASGRSELADWLRLVETPGVGPITVHRLLSELGPPRDVLATAEAVLARIAGPRVARSIRAADARREQRVDATLGWAGAAGHHLVTWAHADYPPQLLQIGDPPPVLYLRGARAALSRPMIAVVGSRNATIVGQSNARAFARTLSDAGFTVVSGLALGVDGAAHEGALAGGGGTVAVLGTGVDVVYPTAHRALADRIESDGALLSELPLGAAATAGAFPRRNRLIAGLARAVLVVEAAVRSGSLITAQQAAEFGRDVFAIPGSIHSPLARGCHALIKQGAKLVESADDVLCELGQAVPHGSGLREIHSEGIGEPPLLAAIGHEPVLPDVLAARLDMPISGVTAGLLRLELNGSILRLSDGRVQRPSPNG